MSGNALRETLGFIGVVASLVFVGYEIRQNTQTARAAAYQAIGIATAELHDALAHDPVLARLVTRPSNEFTDSEAQRVFSNLVAWIRMSEMVYTQVELGILPDDAMERLGYGSLGNELFACSWPDLRESVGEAFRDYVENSYDYSVYDCPDWVVVPD
jgi:hypothetical protein